MDIFWRWSMFLNKQYETWYSENHLKAPVYFRVDLLVNML